MIKFFNLKLKFNCSNFANWLFFRLISGGIFCAASLAYAQNLISPIQLHNPYPEIIKNLRPSIVGVGILSQTTSPNFKFSGAGFIVGDGLWIVTNAHVLPPIIDHTKNEELAIFQFQPQAEKNTMRVTSRLAEVRHKNLEHDIAILRIRGEPLPALKIRRDATLIPEGSEVLFSGLALGQNFGNSLTTHRGMIAAITPSALPIPQATGLNPEAVRAMRDPTFMIYQLDATAFPGHSGSPLIDVQSREVVGIISGGFVKSSRETAVQSAIHQPTGITYAVPIQYVGEWLRSAQASPH